MSFQIQWPLTAFCWLISAALDTTDHSCLPETRGSEHPSLVSYCSIFFLLTFLSLFPLLAALLNMVGSQSSIEAHSVPRLKYHINVLTIHTFLSSFLSHPLSSNLKYNCLKTATYLVWGSQTKVALTAVSPCSHPCSLSDPEYSCSSLCLL